MLKLSQFIQELISPTPLKSLRKPAALVVIWNLIHHVQ